MFVPTIKTARSQAEVFLTLSIVFAMSLEIDSLQSLRFRSQNVLVKGSNCGSEQHRAANERILPLALVNDNGLCSLSSNKRKKESTSHSVAKSGKRKQNAVLHRTVPTSPEPTGFR